MERGNRDGTDTGYHNSERLENRLNVYGTTVNKVVNYTSLNNWRKRALGF